MPTLRQLRYLVALADTLSFRQAAKACHVTQPTLSDQIRELEKRLKVELFERTRRSVTPTPIGREIAERARVVLRDVQDIVDLADRGRHVLTGTLRLGVLPSLGPYLLPLILPYLHRQYPDLTLYVREDTREGLLRRLGDGDLDLLLYPLPLNQDGFTVSALFREPLLLALPNEAALGTKEQIAPEDLKGLTVLALESGHSLYEQVLALCRQYGATPLLDFATTSLDTLRQMAAMGLGATFLPALYVRSEARRDPLLAVIPFAHPGPSRDIGMVWRSQSARHSEYQTLAVQIRDLLADDVPDVEPLPEK